MVMAMELRFGRIFAIHVTFCLCLLLGSSLVSSSEEELQIINAERRIDLTSHIIKTYLTIKVENNGLSPASEVVVAFPPNQADKLAVVKAALAAGKKKKTTYSYLDVSPKLPDGPNGAKHFSVSLSKPLNAGEAVTLEILYVLTHSLEPFPEEIGQSESQLVYYRDSAIILSPYLIKKQITYLKMPSRKVASYTDFTPTKQVGTELKYGPYENQVAYSFSPILVHFENNSPFAVVEELVREVEISHWGSIQVTEHYSLAHGGARHKGGFSRVEYQSKPSLSGVSSFKRLLARLPPRVDSVYYRDNIGNISTSNLRVDSRKSELEIEPRYPLFGGWKATFVIGYRLPLEDFLFEAADGKRYLNFMFGCPLIDTVVEKFTIKVVLPEGSKDPSVTAPYPVEQSLETSHSYLDIVGRTVVVLEKKNVVPEHNSSFQIDYNNSVVGHLMSEIFEQTLLPIQCLEKKNVNINVHITKILVYYSFNPVFMLAEPLMLISVFFLIFAACVAYLHIDLSISKDKTA